MAVIAAATLFAPAVIATDASAATKHCAHHSTGACRANSKHPKGVIAKCKDGTYSHSKHAAGACSHHRGVRYWYK